MKIRFYFQLLVVGLVLMTAATGCKRGVKGPTVLPGTTAKAPGPGDGQQPLDLTKGQGQTGTDVTKSPANPDGTIPTTGLEEIENMIADRGVFKANTAYFDFDKTSVKASERTKIEEVAAYLKGTPQNKLQIEGHCDERGTPEYNRALGERRALSLREYIAKLGVDPSRIFTISYGEDRPADPGQDDAAWAKNRRGEFILLKPKPGAQ